MWNSPEVRKIILLRSVDYWHTHIILVPVFTFIICYIYSSITNSLNQQFANYRGTFIIIILSPKQYLSQLINRLIDFLPLIISYL
jgi:hypothetical protein